MIIVCNDSLCFFMKNKLRLAQDEIVELTPGETLLETKDEVEKLVLGQSEAEGSQVPTMHACGYISTYTNFNIQNRKSDGSRVGVGSWRLEPHNRASSVVAFFWVLDSPFCLLVAFLASR